ncbi:hypothetical protein J3R83DRAFT_5538 [Lanmaoa asiatica]|nr:hypothetical protein J3R83DRAFT_5538 [Lanmaoa asiatica]
MMADPGGSPVSLDSLDPRSPPSESSNGSERAAAFELDSNLSETLVDPDDSGSHNGSVVEFSETPSCLFAALYTLTHEWWLIALDSFMQLTHDILTNQIPLGVLAKDSLRINCETVHWTVEMCCARRRSIPNPPWEPAQVLVGPTLGIGNYHRTEISARDKYFMELIGVELRNVARSYLTKVWHAIDILICPSPAPPDAGYPLLSLLPSHPHAYFLPETRRLIAQNTTWSQTSGYAFFHSWTTIAGEESIVWFANTATRDLLYHALANSQSLVWIGVTEFFPSPLGQNPLSSPIIVGTIEKIAFVLSWVVVEMRGIALRCYEFENSVYLTEDHVAIVAAEYDKVYRLLNSILFGPDTTQQRALLQWLELGPVDYSTI